ncbi:MAG: hypothetical protein RL112_680 [Planctomycetota bacterium]
MADLQNLDGMNWITQLGYEPLRKLSQDATSEVWQVQRAGQMYGLRAGSSVTELGVLASMEHPNLLRLVDHGVLPDGRVWYAREWAQGLEYSAWLALRPRGIEEACSVAAAACDALAYLHGRGLLHGDMSPRNLLVGGNGVVKLADYGLVQVAGARVRAAFGTPFFMAPEVIQQEHAGPAVDLFALGAVLARGWAAEEADPRVFHSRFPQLDYFAARGARRDQLPHEVSDLVEALLERDLRRRPADAAAVARAFRERGGGGRKQFSARDLRIPTNEAREAFYAAELPRLFARAATEEARAGVACWRVEHADDALLVAQGAALAASLQRWPFHVVVAQDIANEPGALDGAVSLALSRSFEGVVCIVTSEGEAARAVQARLEVEAVRHDRRVVCVGPIVPAGCARVVELESPAARDLLPALRRQIEAGDEQLLAFGEWLLEAARGREAHLPGAAEKARRAGVLQEGRERWRLRPGAWPKPPTAGRAVEASGLDPLATRALALLFVARRPLAQEEMADALGISAEAAATLAGSLADAGLVRAQDGGWRADAKPAGAGWHQPLRAAHVRCALVSPPQEAALHLAVGGEAHVRERRVAELAAMREEGRSEEALDRLRELAQALEECGIAAPASLFDALSACHAAMGRAAEAEAAVEGLRTDEPAARAARLAAAGRAALLRHEEAQAWESFKAAAALDPRHAPDLLLAEAVLHHATRADQQLEACVERLQSLESARERHRANARSLLAMARLRRGDVERAGMDVQALVARATERDEPLQLAAALVNLATLKRRTGDERAAANALERAAELHASRNNLAGQAQALTLLAGVWRELGEAARASDGAAHALLLRERLGDEGGALTARAIEALAWVDRGGARRALLALGSATQALRAAGRGTDAELLAARMDEQQARLGRPEGAEEREARRKEGTAKDADPRALHARGRAAWMRGEPERGQELCQRAFDLAERLRQPTAAQQARATLELMAAAREKREPDARICQGSEDARCAALVCARELDHNAARALAEDLLARGRNDRAARLLVALAARGEGPRAKEDRTLALDLLKSCCAGLSEKEAGELQRRLLSLPDPRPEDLRALSEEARSDDADLKQLLAINRRLVAQEDLPALLATIVQCAVEVSGAERGFLVLQEEGRFVFDTARDSAHGEIANPEEEVSTSILAETLRLGTVLRLSNAGQDPQLGAAPSIVALELRSILCAPFTVDQRTSGVVYLDHRVRTGAFGARAEYLLGLLADQAALAIRQVKRLDELRETARRLKQDVQAAEGSLKSTESMLSELRQLQPANGLVGKSGLLREVQRMIERAAPATLPVLLTGESGTGKELAARAIHARSLRAGGPFVRESLGALPPALLEAELFGWKRGAFSGAEGDRVGILESATGGTLFLDEVGELPLDVQAKLLRALESGEVRRLGESRPRPISPRIVAATRYDLEAEVRAGRFRADLYYRLDGLRIRLPSLAERQEDIPLLVEHFLRQESVRMSRSFTIAPEVLAALARRAWPGNVRELRNEVARLCALSEGEIVDAELVRPVQELAPTPKDELDVPLLSLAELERLAIAKALRSSEGDRGKAAEILGISRAKIYQRLKEWREAGVPLPE